MLPVMSFSCNLVVTCWARAALFAPLYVIFSCVYITLPHSVLGHVWNLIVSIPDLCLLLYFAQGHYAVPPVRLQPATSLSRLKHSTTGYCTCILCGDYDEVSDYCYVLGVKGQGQIYLTNVDVNSFFIFVIVRPANRDWVCQTERCHTLSNKTSLQ